MDSSDGITIRTPSTSQSVLTGITFMETKLPDTHIDRLVEHINDNDQQHRVKQLLIRYGKLFDTKKPTIASNVESHEIKTLDHPPPTSKAYYSTPQKQEAMEKLFKNYYNQV